MSVDTLINDARTFTAGLATTAKDAIASAITAVERVGYTALTYSGSTLPAPPPSTITATLPTLDTVTLDLPAEPSDTLVFQDISPVEPGDLPTLDAEAPTIKLPDEPAALAQFTQVAPVINTSFVFPEPPSQLMNPLLDAPTITNRDEPDKPQVLLPMFSTAAPVDDTQAPEDLQATFDAAYRNAAPSTIAMLDGYVDAMLTKYNPRFHEQMAAIEEQLEAFLQGGTGFTPAVENAIYERARSKNNAESRRARDTAYSDAARMGFTMPPGALLSAVQVSRQAAFDNNAQANREIVVKQAELEQQNLQFAVTQSMNLRQTVLSASLNYHQNLITINGQALDTAKAMVANILEVYNASVRAFGLRLDAYRADAAVYETKLKGAMASIDLYKAEIDALQAMTNVDRARIDVYQARISVLNSLSSVYRSQIDAVQGRASLEKLKLDLFQAQAQTFTTQVQAKNAEWQGYTAAINGQRAIAEVYGTQVQAYNAQLTGYKAGIDAKVEVVRAQALTNEARARNYSAVLSGYQTIAQTRGEVARTKLENQRQAVVAYQAKLQGQVASAQVAAEYYKSVANVGIANADLSIKAAVASSQMQQSYTSVLANLANSNANTMSSLTSSAMSGMNTLVAQTLSE